MTGASASYTRNSATAARSLGLAWRRLRSQCFFKMPLDWSVWKILVLVSSHNSCLCQLILAATLYQTAQMCWNRPVCGRPSRGTREPENFSFVRSGGDEHMLGFFEQLAGYLSTDCVERCLHSLPLLWGRIWMDSKGRLNWLSIQMRNLLHILKRDGCLLWFRTIFYSEAAPFSAAACFARPDSTLRTYRSLHWRTLQYVSAYIRNFGTMPPKCAKLLLEPVLAIRRAGPMSNKAVKLPCENRNTRECWLFFAIR